MDSVRGDVGTLEEIDREPRMHIMADLNNEKFNLNLSQCRVELNGLPCYSAKSEASLLYTTDAIVPIPPAAENNSGEKKPCSTSRTRSSYTLFVSSYFLQLVLVIALS